MLRSMYSGISGVKNFQTKLDVIGNNIANVNTYGFKKGRVTFKDLMSQTVSGASRPGLNVGGQNPKQVGLGATIATIDLIDTQGSLQTTGRVLDVGINGDGYFTVAQGNNLLYTRAGNFYLDSDGSLVTGDGMKVQGYNVRDDGTIDRNTIKDIVLDTNTVMPPSETTFVNFGGNLSAEAPVYIEGEPKTADGRVTIDYKVKDQLGRDITLQVEFTKTENNKWSYKVKTSDPNVDGVVQDNKITEEILGLTKLTGPEITLDSNRKNVGTLVFEEGKVDLLDVSTPPSNPSNNMVSIDLKTTDNLTVPIKLDFSNITQFASASTADVEKMDGNAEGYLESFNIGASGEINGVYSNGQVATQGQLVVATFANNGGLMKAGNNYFQASNNSGIPNYGVANEGRGALQSGALEMSNVDLSEEFTEMIVAQRGFQANTRIITTSDEILQELVNLKR